MKANSFKVGDRVIWRKQSATVTAVRMSSLYYAPGVVGYELRLDDGKARSVAAAGVKAESPAVTRAMAHFERATAEVKAGTFWTPEREAKSAELGAALERAFEGEDEGDFPCQGFKGCERRVGHEDGVCGPCQDREPTGGCPGCGGNCQVACR